MVDLYSLKIASEKVEVINEILKEMEGFIVMFKGLSNNQEKLLEIGAFLDELNTLYDNLANLKIIKQIIDTFNKEKKELLDLIEELDRRKKEANEDFINEIENLARALKIENGELILTDIPSGGRLKLSLVDGDFILEY